MASTERSHALEIVGSHLDTASAARKCAPCGCFARAVDAVAASPAVAELGPVLDRARAVVTTAEYDCLGCPVCEPAIATNALAELYPTVDAGCPTDVPAPRRGWPPLPGDYQVLRARAPVAVCTLDDDDLASRIAAADPQGLSIVGTLRTENLGIERIVHNVLANPSLRFLVLCGEDGRRAVGHLPGASLACLFENGLDGRGRIPGAPGKRPVIKNLPVGAVDAFRDQVTLLDRRGDADADAILAEIDACRTRDPGPVEGAAAPAGTDAVEAIPPARLVPDPAGYFVVYPDGARSTLVVEHFTNDGVLDCVLEGAEPAAIYATAIDRGLLTRLDHAAYLGRELARAEGSLETGAHYVQDRASGEVAVRPDAEPDAGRCACGSPGCDDR